PQWDRRTAAGRCAVGSDRRHGTVRGCNRGHHVELCGLVRGEGRGQSLCCSLPTRVDNVRQLQKECPTELGTRYGERIHGGKPKMLHAIDADTHLFEPTQVWDFIDEEMYPRRPIIVSGPGDTVYRRSSFWLIDGNIFPKSAGKGGFLLGTPTEPGQCETTPDVRARELLDIPGRLQAMDLMGVATQVVYPTLFLAYITDDVKLEVALCRSYNRFMAGVWEQAQGRLRWVVVPPLRSIDASIAEINFAKEHGAVGLFFRGIERDRTLDDPYFFPVYQEAARL